MVNVAPIQYWRCVSCDRLKRMPCIFITTSTDNQYVSCSGNDVPQWIEIRYGEAIQYLGKARSDTGDIPNNKAEVGRFDDLEFVSGDE